jgi:hypothetical protein
VAARHELGIIDRRFAPGPRPDEAGGAVTYWHVDDVEAAFARLLALGATAHEKPVERGPGFVTASVVDPFGNVLGVMYNQHYLQVVERCSIRATGTRRSKRVRRLGREAVRTPLLGERPEGRRRSLPRRPRRNADTEAVADAVRRPWNLGVGRSARTRR